jgi:hemolysin type calcium-binding protein
VRGPTPAAAKRLMQGVVAACAVAAVYAAPAGASTVSNVHPIGVAGPAAYDDAAGVGTTLTLTSTGPDGVALTDADTVTTADALVDSGVVTGLDDEDTCIPPDPPATPPAPTDPPVLAQWTCSLSTRLSLNLGGGDDRVKVGDNLPPLDVNGGAGTDTVDYSTGTKTQDVDLTAGTADGMTLTNVENVTGGPGGDTIAGDANANAENGNGGNDVLKGDAGDDTLNGGAGINSLYGGDGTDNLTAGDGGDRLDGGAGVDTLTGGAGDDVIVAADGFADNITCGAGFDTVTADLGANGPPDNVDQASCESIVGVAPQATDPGTGTTTTVQPVIVVPALGTPALTQVLAPGKADFADLTPPAASMRSFTRQRLHTVLTKGVPIRVTCKEACGISVALSVDTKTARRLKLDARKGPVVVATASARRAIAGTTVLHVRFTKPARAAMKKSKRGIVATTQVLVSDASGNGTLLSRHVTLVH